MSIDYTKATLKFETETCTRCGGTGRYPSAAWNGVCLGCNGAGQKYTRRGATAHKRFWGLVEQNVRPAHEIKAGDVMVRGTKKIKVHESKASERPVASRCTTGSGENAVTTVTAIDWILVTRRADGQYVHNHMSREDAVVVWPTGEKLAEIVGQVAHLKGAIVGERQTA